MTRVSRKPAVKKARVVPDTEFSDTFVQGMYDRMCVSFFKYGAVAKAYPEHVNAIQSLQQRLERYAADGNTEWLIDAANFAMIEFMRPAHPKAHFRGTDSKESPGRIRARDGVASWKDNRSI